jgi:hypothetical protein
MIRYERPTADIGALIRWKAALLFRAESLLTPTHLVDLKPSHIRLSLPKTHVHAASFDTYTHILHDIWALSFQIKQFYKNISVHT